MPVVCFIPDDVLRQQKITSGDLVFLSVLNFNLTNFVIFIFFLVCVHLVNWASRLIFISYSASL